MKKMKFALLFVGILTLGIWPAIDWSQNGSSSYAL
jgi:hypothetical protein